MEYNEWWDGTKHLSGEEEIWHTVLRFLSRCEADTSARNSYTDFMNNLCRIPSVSCM